jgi:hypothetical protein
MNAHIAKTVSATIVAGVISTWKSVSNTARYMLVSMRTMLHKDRGDTFNSLKSLKNTLSFTRSQCQVSTPICLAVGMALCRRLGRACFRGIRQPDLCLSAKAARDLWLVSWGALAIWPGLVTQIKDNILFAAYGGLAPDS